MYEKCLVSRNDDKYRSGHDVKQFIIISRYSFEFQRNSAVEHDFDILIFAQTWPITHCIFWMDQKITNDCLLPPQRNTWTIHGIWPNKATGLGPFYCDNSSPLNISALQPLRYELNKLWPNTHKGRKH